VYESQPVYIAEPCFSTGAGDNFNAGYCIANLLGLNLELSLIVANATSNRYITTGISPGIAELNAYFSELIIASL
jgi:sugar/nucleoside kinase (ribokinase family)